MTRTTCSSPETQETARKVRARGLSQEGGWCVALPARGGLFGAQKYQANDIVYVCLIIGRIRCSPGGRAIKNGLNRDAEL